MLSFFTVRVMAYICAALGAVIIGLSIALWAQGVQVGHLENERDAAINRVAKALQTIEGQKTALDACDKQTKALKVESDKKASDADEAVRRAKEEARKYVEANKRRAVLLAAPTPAGAGCREALAVIRGKQ